MSEGFAQAFRMIAGLDRELFEIILLSIRVSFTAVLLALLVALPFGAVLAIGRFPGRRALIVLMNAMMGLPPVVVGLALYLLFSRSGPLGVLEFLYTPTAMIIAQMVLVIPIVTAISRQVIADMHAEYDEMLRTLGASRIQMLGTVLWEARSALMTVALAGLGRALSEVGAVMIVGGNINHVTRVMTTAVALETSRGNLGLALALGLILLVLSLLVNTAVALLRNEGREVAHA